MASWDKTTIPEEEKTSWEMKWWIIRDNAPRQAFRAFKARLGRWIFVYPWKISRMSRWINENKINDEKGKQGKRWPTDQKRSLLNPGMNPLVPQRNFGAWSEEYKYPTILYPLSMSDSREDRGREEISRVSPCDYIFSDKWDPPGSPLKMALTTYT